MKKSNIRIVSECVVDRDGNIVAERPEDCEIIVGRCTAFVAMLETGDLHTYDHETRTITRYRMIIFTMPTKTPT